MLQENKQHQTDPETEPWSGKYKRTRPADTSVTMHDMVTSANKGGRRGAWILTSSVVLYLFLQKLTVRRSSCGANKIIEGIVLCHPAHGPRLQPTAQVTPVRLVE
jgi:hypothetical protein